MATRPDDELDFLIKSALPNTPVTQAQKQAALKALYERIEQSPAKNPAAEWLQWFVNTHWRMVSHLLLSDSCYHRARHLPHRATANLWRAGWYFEDIRLLRPAY